MSDVTETARAYKAGTITFAQLRFHMVNREWTGVPHTPPDNVMERHGQGEWDVGTTEGSGEELLQVALMGLLTSEEYLELVQAIWDKTH